MVDNLSQGRVGISFASGWNRNDFLERQDLYDNRHSDLYYKCAKFIDLCSSNVTSYKEKSGQNSKDISVYPKLFSKKMPVWISASKNKETFKRAGELKVNILTHVLAQSLNDLKDNISLYKEKYSTENIDNSYVTLMLHTFIYETDIEYNLAKRSLKRYMKQHIDLLSTGIDIKNNEMLDEKFIDNIICKFIDEKTLIIHKDDAINKINQYINCGVNEIACLFDFGLPENIILRGLDRLSIINKHIKTKKHEAKITMPFDAIKESVKEIIKYNNIIKVNDMPINNNGKIDYNKLKNIIINKENNITITSNEDKHELNIKNIWINVLGINNISIDDSLYSIGGNSLNAISILSDINDEYKTSIGMDDFYGDSATIRNLANHVKNSDRTLGYSQKVDIPNDTAASEIQKGIWMQSQLNNNDASYNDNFILDILNNISSNIIIDAIKDIVDNNDIFNYKYINTSNGIEQILCNSIIDIETYKINDSKYNILYNDQFTSIINKASLNQYDISIGNTYKFIIFSLLDGLILFIGLHHIITDGQTIANIISNISKYIDSMNHDKRSVSSSYYDYIHEEALYRHKNINRQLVDKYVKDQNISDIKNNILGTRKYRSNLSRKGVKRYILLDSDSYKKIKTCIKRNSISMSALFLTIYAACLSKHIEEDLIQIGCPLSLRDNLYRKGTMGPLINMGIINSKKIDNNTPWKMYIDYINMKYNLAIENRYITYSDIIKSIVPERAETFNPLFQYVYSCFNKETLDIEKNNIKMIPYDYGVARYDIEMHVGYSGDYLNVEFIFDQSIFNNLYINRFTEDVSHIINSIVDDNVYHHRLDDNNTNKTYWNMIYNNLYHRITNQFVGWTKKLSNEPYTNDEMNAWKDNIIQKLSTIDYKNVIEIGCGTGIITDIVKDRCHSYLGIDASYKSIQHMKDNHKESKCKFVCCDALDIGMYAEYKYDLIIINSVVQYFESIQYLSSVIKESLDILSPDGCIFIGDVRNSDWFNVETYYQMKAAKVEIASESMIEKYAKDDMELRIPPSFFRCLNKISPFILDIDVAPKIAIMNNDLSLFRYDVLLKHNIRTCKNTKYRVFSNILTYKSSDYTNLDYFIIENIDIKHLDEIINKTFDYAKDYLEIDRELKYLIYTLENKYNVSLQLSPLNPYKFFLMCSKKGKDNIILNDYINHLNPINASAFPIINIYDADQDRTNIENIRKGLIGYDNVESYVVEIFREICDNININVNDMFSDIDCDSMRTIEVTNRLRKIGFDITPNIIFGFQTIAQLIEQLRKIWKK
jgi:natural product biosynthesis luciferase-like monooxygenase protein